ncbi:hypothetical protein [Streptomyces sp. NPDC090798]|uniref:hypothetical protein n=1 Tax=Streptomyces sp. NPDC090798 TaxID=3365968 RepID=UPI00380EE970
MEPTAETEYDTPRKFRAPDDEWEPFEAATRAVHPEGRSPRGRVIREFMRWYMRRPGAKLPERPAAGPWTRSANACNAPGDAPNSSGKERCELPAGHAGRHYEGITTWPQRKRPVGSEEKNA